jgi:Inactive homolog of metal-dependent proteases, putative molecular chaperone
VSCGPGSYTGLRIGVSMAKGVCYGLNVPLIGIPTLEVLCVPILLHQEELPENALLCPMIDARRMLDGIATVERARMLVGVDVFFPLKYIKEEQKDELSLQYFVGFSVNDVAMVCWEL